ncbi:hypothetical protein [Sediminicurvatus halobius]|uniref:Uncharacterized protein n=1 Tax=Sediminicurvatus halobius TaxID=2182432 RepID=A0A2U2MVP1_9GAMM|nr:hypothetical protein [Spiribacter halobius]PWG60927.1 hypothetical protein DEM34_19085 [Spiribacter halobius]UEX76605.1 hypothetical protein LMH63_11620 [Spiribacter halobius]
MGQHRAALVTSLLLVVLLALLLGGLSPAVLYLGVAGGGETTLSLVFILIAIFLLINLGGAACVFRIATDLDAECWRVAARMLSTAWVMNTLLLALFLALDSVAVLLK